MPTYKVLPGATTARQAGSQMMGVGVPMAGGAPVTPWLEELATLGGDNEPTLLDDMSEVAAHGANKALQWLKSYGDPRPPKQEETKMPGPIDGLKQAGPSVDDLIKQRQAVNQKMGGMMSPPQGQPMPVAPQGPPRQAGGFTFMNPQTPDIQGLAQAMQAAGMQGSRTTDIDLDAQPQMGIDELIKRAQAIPTGQ